MDQKKNTAQRLLFVALLGCAAILPYVFIDSPLFARVFSIGGICLLLWIGEAVPPFVPTLLLWALVPLFLTPFGPQYSAGNVLSWAADPVMALFFGGFVLGAAAQKSGLDRRLTQMAFRYSGRSFALFLLIVISLTAFLSMWMSNIAAGALVISCLKPALDEMESGDLLRRTVLIGIALGADFGGIATPIGTGPNAIAIASLSSTQPVSFVGWMSFAFPLTVLTLLASFAFLFVRVGAKKNDWKPSPSASAEGGIVSSAENAEKAGQARFLLVISITIVLWLTEPFHKIPASVIALAASAVIFGLGILGRKDLLRLDWSTLLLIAGGITLGRLLERSEIVNAVAGQIPFGQMHPTIGIFILCLASALMSALMSNTATVVLLIPIATLLIPLPSTAILIAISASFGVPFLISTPPNAMVFGQGGVRFGDLFWPGVVLMLAGSLAVSLTGKAVLNLVGIP